MRAGIKHFFLIVLVVSAVAPSTYSDDTYVDLSSLFDQDGFITGGTGTGKALDDTNRWLDAATLPTTYTDGTPLKTADGLATFKFGALRGSGLDCVRIAGQTIPLPAGKYERLQMALLSTDGDMNDLSRIMTLNYSDGTSDKIQLGPIAGWFNSPMAYDDSILTFFDKSTVKYILNITPQQNDEEYIVDISGSANEVRTSSRFMDGTSVLTYEFALPADMTGGTLGIDMQNNFVVSMSKDHGATFEEVLNSFNMLGKDEHNGSNRDVYKIDLASWLSGNADKTIQVQFTDGSTGDGWGPEVFNVSVYTGEIVKYSQRQVSQLDTSKAKIYADFQTDAGENEAKYLFDSSSQAPTSQGHRFADGGGFITYKIGMPSDVTQAKAALNLNGNFVVSVGTGGNLVTHVSFVPNQNDLDYIYEISGSANEARDDYRFVDGTGVLTYVLTLPQELTGATLNLDMQNNFIVGVAKETSGDLVFEEVLNSQKLYGSDIHDGSNRKFYTVDLAQFLTNNPTKTLYIRFTDGTTNDGWGPAIFKVSITSGSGADFTEVFSAISLTENSLVPYNHSGGQDRGYYTVDLTPYLAKATDKQILIKLTDETPSDGWGPGVYRVIVYSGDLVIRTDGTCMAGLVPTGGLPENAYPWGANIVRREYAVNSGKTLQSVTFPTLVESLGTKLYLFAATLEGTKTQVSDWSLF